MRIFVPVTCQFKLDLTILPVVDPESVLSAAVEKLNHRLSLGPVYFNTVLAAIHAIGVPQSLLVHQQLIFVVK